MSNENQTRKIEAEKIYALSGKTILAIANLLKDELPVRYANQAYRVEGLLATAQEVEVHKEEVPDNIVALPEVKESPVVEPVTE